MRSLAPTAIALAAAAAPIAAQDFDEMASINLFFGPPSYSGCDGFSGADVPSCGGTSASNPGGVQFLWVVAERNGGFPNGIGGIQFGIDHSLSIGGFDICTGGFEIPSDTWPASGSGNAVAFPDACYVPSGNSATIGYFTILSSTGSMELTGDPRLAGVDLICDGSGSAVYIDCDDPSDGICICDRNLAEADVAVGAERICATTCMESTVDVGSPTHVEPGALRVEGLRNPVRSASAFVVEIGDDAVRHALILDVNGRRVRSLDAEALAPGRNDLVWDLADDAGRPVSAGRYFLRVETTSAVATSAITVIR